MTIEFTAYDRPRRLASTTHLSSMDIKGVLSFEPVPEGTRMKWVWDIQPRDFYKLIGPLVRRIGERQERAIWTGLKHVLEKRERLSQPATVIAASQEAHRFTSLRHLAAICGGLAGVGGITHGIGEVMQGSRSPGGIVFNSWAEGRIASNLGGEPAMSVVPNLLITGILTIVVSLALLAWAVGFFDRRHAGSGLVLLSVAILMVGGGFGPPLVGMLAGAAAAGASVGRQRRTSLLAGRPGSLLAPLWPYLFWLCVLNAIFLVLGSPLLAGAFDVAAPSLFVYSLFLAVVSLPLATLAGIAYKVRGVFRITQGRP